MYNQKSLKSGRHSTKRQTAFRRGVPAGALVLLALVLVACSSASPSTEMPAPTSTPIPEAVNDPSVAVADQAIVDGRVIVAEVVSDGSGWLVIHAQKDGGIGPVLGYSPVADGANAEVAVEINLTDATETLYAMLHTDAGTIGTYEFPGDDVPVKVSEKVVAPPFSITGGLAVEEVTPSVAVVNQEIVDGTVTVAEVVSDGSGWLVIHAQKDGKPGPILGYRSVADGTNTDVIVELDVANATETLYAMLHTDAGEVGAWEFPDGPDAPVKIGEQVVTPPFNVTGGLAATAEEIVPFVAVADQEIVDGTVTVTKVVSDGPGWLVIHAQQDDKPGSILGYSPVVDGVNADVAVEIDLSGATETLYAMLHTDAGMVGTYEFPGDDAPTKVDDAIVMAPFALPVVEGEAQVRMVGFAFDQTNLIVRAGTTITWINNDNARHTATSDTGIWDSGMFGQDESFSLTFDEPGIYPYYCKPHGGPAGQGMAGTIIVIPA